MSNLYLKILRFFCARVKFYNCIEQRKKAVLYDFFRGGLYIIGANTFKSFPFTPATFSS